MRRGAVVALGQFGVPYEVPGTGALTRRLGWAELASLALRAARPGQTQVSAKMRVDTQVHLPDQYHEPGRT